MALMLKVGEYHQMAAVPRNFPTCYDYSTQVDADNIKASATSQKLHIQMIAIILALVSFIL